jgi:hypothetical protein
MKRPINPPFPEFLRTPELAMHYCVVIALKTANYKAGRKECLRSRSVRP